MQSGPEELKSEREKWEADTLERGADKNKMAQGYSGEDIRGVRCIQKGPDPIYIRFLILWLLLSIPIVGRVCLEQA
jgi:hypothetical protein